MSITTTTHLNFRGEARSALSFYASVFAGATSIVTYGDAGAAQDPADDDLVMWGQTASDTGFAVMAYDVPTRGDLDRGEHAFFVSVRGDHEDELRRLWAGLAEGGDVVQDLAPAGWSPLYGMVTDQFGVTWVLDIAVAYDG